MRWRYDWPFSFARFDRGRVRDGERLAPLLLVSGQTRAFTQLFDKLRWAEQRFVCGERRFLWSRDRFEFIFVLTCR